VKIIKAIALLLSVFFSIQVFAAVTPPGTTDKTSVADFTKMKSKEFEKLTGKKLTLLEKIQLKLLQKKLRKYDDEEITSKQKKLATWSMFLGIASLILLFIPYLVLLAIPAALLAMIFGMQSLKGNSNAKAIIGVVTGGVTLLLILVALVFVAALIAGGG
jgi:hypothetical protein